VNERDDIPKRLREQSVGDYSVSLWDEAADEIESLRAENAQLTAERDEARRELCQATAFGRHDSAEDAAAYRGWDCFDAKEAKP
jgi:hypothetical protein